MIKRQNKLKAYLSVTAGIGCVSSVANAALTVTFFGPGAQSPTSDPATPNNLTIANGFIDNNGSYNSGTIFVRTYTTDTGNFAFLRESGISSGLYNDGGSTNLVTILYMFGALGLTNNAVSGDDNFARINLVTDANIFDPTHDSVAQFNLDEDGNSFLVALAQNTDGTPLSLLNGLNAINAASAPEPSSLVLLALGSIGLAARRQRKKSAY